MPLRPVSILGEPKMIEPLQDKILFFVEKYLHEVLESTVWEPFSAATVVAKDITDTRCGVNGRSVSTCSVIRTALSGAV